MNQLLFYLVILLTNIIQGITGFAGTILAMPVSIDLVGYNTAQPILNFLGLLAGVYVAIGHRKSICFREVGKIILFMAAGIFAGFGLKHLVVGHEKILYVAFGCFILFIAVKGLVKTLFGGKLPTAVRRTAAGSRNAVVTEAGGRQQVSVDGTATGGWQPAPTVVWPDGSDSTMEPAQAVEKKQLPSWESDAVLAGAGVIHGIFVSGGPLVVSYLSGRVPDKEAFRSTISTVWIVLNGIILASDIAAGLYTAPVVREQLISIPFLLGGMVIGGALFRRMQQKTFMLLTYVLLIASGILMLFK